MRLETIKIIFIYLINSYGALSPNDTICQRDMRPLLAPVMSYYVHTSLALHVVSKESPASKRQLHRISKSFLPLLESYRV